MKAIELKFPIKIFLQLKKICLKIGKNENLSVLAPTNSNTTNICHFVVVHLSVVSITDKWKRQATRNRMKFTNKQRKAQFTKLLRINHESAKSYNFFYNFAMLFMEFVVDFQIKHDEQNRATHNSGKQLNQPKTRATTQTIEFFSFSEIKVFIANNIPPQ